MKKEKKINIYVSQATMLLIGAGVLAAVAYVTMPKNKKMQNKLRLKIKCMIMMKKKKK